MRELEGRVERLDSSPAGGVVWDACCSCMHQVSVEGVGRVLPSVRRLGALPAARRRCALLRWVPRGEPLRVRAWRMRWAAAVGLARCALRAFFHTLRAAAACLRARLASRLASFTRLRARLS